MSCQGQRDYPRPNDDEFQVKLTNTNIYNNYGDLVKVCRDILIDRLSYLLPLSESAGLHITLKDVVAWVRKDCGLRITEQDIKTTVDRYMRDRLELSNDVLFACSKRWQGQDVGWCDSLKQNAFENSGWKHGMSQNACTKHERPQLLTIVFGRAAVGVSVNTEVCPTKLCAAAPEFRPRSAHQQTNSDWCAKYIADMMGSNGGHSANRGAVGIGNEVPVGGSAFNRFKTNYEQATISGTCYINVTQNESNNGRGFPCGMRPMSESADSLINSNESDCFIYLNNNLTGFEPPAVLGKESIRVVGAGRHMQNE